MTRRFTPAARGAARGGGVGGRRAPSFSADALPPLERAWLGSATRGTETGTDEGDAGNIPEIPSSTTEDSSTHASHPATRSRWSLVAQAPTSATESIGDADVLLGCTLVLVDLRRKDQGTGSLVQLRDLPIGSAVPWVGIVGPDTDESALRIRDALGRPVFQFTTTAPDVLERGPEHLRSWTRPASSAGTA